MQRDELFKRDHRSTSNPGLGARPFLRPLPTPGHVGPPPRQLAGGGSVPRAPRRRSARRERLAAGVREAVVVLPLPLLQHGHHPAARAAVPQLGGADQPLECRGPVHVDAGAVEQAVAWRARRKGERV